MVFGKRGRLTLELRFYYNNNEVAIVSQFTYLCIIFTTGKSFKQTFDSLHGQSLKSIFKLKSILNKFPCINVSHKLDLFDKLITPILGYCSEVWDYWEAAQLETVHLQYMKQRLEVRTQTKNNFVYGELGRFPLQTNRIISVIRYWLKVIA